MSSRKILFLFAVLAIFGLVFGADVKYVDTTYTNVAPVGTIPIISQVVKTSMSKPAGFPELVTKPAVSGNVRYGSFTVYNESGYKQDRTFSLVQGSYGKILSDMDINSDRKLTISTNPSSPEETGIVTDVTFVYISGYPFKFTCSNDRTKAQLTSMQWFAGSFLVDGDNDGKEDDMVYFALSDANSDGKYETMDISYANTTYGEGPSLSDGKVLAGNDERITMDKLKDFVIGKALKYTIIFVGSPIMTNQDVKVTRQAAAAPAVKPAASTATPASADKCTSNSQCRGGYECVKNVCTKKSTTTAPLKNLKANAWYSEDGKAYVSLSWNWVSIGAPGGVNIYRTLLPSGKKEVVVDDFHDNHFTDITSEAGTYKYTFVKTSADGTESSGLSVAAVDVKVLAAKGGSCKTANDCATGLVCARSVCTKVNQAPKVSFCKSCSVKWLPTDKNTYGTYLTQLASDKKIEITSDKLNVEFNVTDDTDSLVTCTLYTQAGKKSDPVQCIPYSTANRQTLLCNINASGLAVGTNRVYVACVDSGKLTGYSSTIQITRKYTTPAVKSTTPAKDTTAPDAPTRLKAVQYPNEMKVKVSWTAPSASDLAGYHLFRAMNGPVSAKSELKATIPKSAPYYNDSVTSAGIYNYTMAAYDNVPNVGVIASPAEVKVVAIKPAASTAKKADYTVCAKSPECSSGLCIQTKTVALCCPLKGPNCCTEDSQCSSSQYCDMTTRTCKTKPVSADKCTSPSQCKAGYDCVKNICTKKSTTTSNMASKKQGEVCSADKDCVAGLNCYNKICCLSGEVCCSSDKQCDTGQVCDLSTKFCKQKEGTQYIGGYCDNDNDCQFLLAVCFKNKCTDIRSIERHKIGEACSDNRECYSLICTNKICSCKVDEDCGTGMVCKSSKCEKKPAASASSGVPTTFKFTTPLLDYLKDAKLW